MAQGNWDEIHGLNEDTVQTLNWLDCRVESGNDTAAGRNPGVKIDINQGPQKLTLQDSQNLIELVCRGIYAPGHC